MTELIIALDGRPGSIRSLARNLSKAGVRWFKIGPQALCDPDLYRLVDLELGRRVFADFKLADTAASVSEAVKRMANSGVSAVSTYTARATEAAMMAAEGTPLRVWKLVALSDGGGVAEGAEAHGFIVPPAAARNWQPRGFDFIVPGVRSANQDSGGHLDPIAPRKLPALGVTHAVVGRPIWQASDPVAAAQRYRAALREAREGEGDAG